MKKRWGMKWSGSGGTLDQQQAPDELDVRLQKGLHSRVRSYPDMGLPSVGEDETDDAAAVIPLTNSPGTPNGWEHQYSRFLQRSKRRPPPHSITSIDQDPPASRSSSLGSSTTCSMHTPLGASPTEINETSVRGGKLFSNLSFLVERRHRSSTTNSNNTLDELDETKRRGIPTSPSSLRHRTLEQVTSIHSMPRLPALLPPVNAPGVMIAMIDATMKKAFTDFHNSSANTEAPYLGEERSVHNNHHHGVYCPNQHTTILRRIATVDTWKMGRRYLMLPAVYAACEGKTLQCLHATPVTASDHMQDHHSIRLGECWLSDLKQQRQYEPEWKPSILRLEHNYLLEVDDQNNIQAAIHLEFAVAKPHEHFGDTIELFCYGSPCAKADPKRILIRLKVPSEERASHRTLWMDAINRMARLQLSDLYDLSHRTLLGESQYVQVKSVTNRSTGVQRALKIFNKAKFWKAVVKGQERADTIVREIAVQATIRAQAEETVPIVRIYGVFETTQEIALELELLEGTDLFRYVSSKNVLAEAEAACILRDVLTALDTMNSLGLAHRDIKPANLLMSDTGGVKVGDFGMSTFVNVDGLVRGRCGTPGYVAPEIFKTGAYGGYGNKVDVFSAGVTLYVCLCGYEPFYGETDQELKEANRRAKVEFPEEEWSHISTAAVDLINQMTDTDPAKRPSAKEALAHEFFQSLAS